MTRGKRPVVAIGEAKRSAVAAGFVLVELITEAELAFDFVVLRDRIASLVRVRRLKQAGFRVANIMRACAQPIAELQSCTLPDQLVRELWVRGPARAYHRYSILPDTVEEIGIVAMPRTSLKVTNLTPVPLQPIPPLLKGSVPTESTDNLTHTESATFHGGIPPGPEFMATR